MKAIGVATLVGTILILAIGSSTAPLPDASGVQDAHWEERAPLPEPRTEVSVATDGERIYLAGGFGPPQNDDERATAPRTLWAYTPENDTWDAIGDVPVGVHHAPFVHHEGRLYILGGFRETSFEPVGDVHIYDIASGEWSEGASMPTPRGASGFTVLDGGIHIIGGNVASAGAVADMDGVQVTDDLSVNVHERYDPTTDSWTRLPPMPTPRNHLGAATVDRRIHAVLGRADGDYRMTTHEIFDSGTGVWETAPDVPTGRSGVAVLALDDYVYTFGGENLAEDDRRTFDDAERFNTESDEWEVLASMPSGRHGLGAAVLEGSIYVVSGGPQPAFTFGDANERLVLQ